MAASISLTAAELAALADTLGEPLPPLGPAELDELPNRRRAELLQLARAALHERGVLVSTPTGDEVAVPVARLVEVLSRPVLSALVYAAPGPRGWSVPTARLAAVPEAMVEQHRVPDGFVLTPHAPDNVIARIAALSGLADGFHAAPGPVTIDARALISALHATSSAVAASELDAGLATTDRDQAGALAAALVGHRVALRVQSRPVGGRRAGLEVAWVAGPAGAWELPLAVTPLAAESGGAAPPGLDRQLVLHPIGAAAVLEAIGALGQ